MTKARLLAELANLHAEWEALVDQFAEDEVDTAVDGAWTLADLVYHLSWYEQEMVRLLIDMRLVGSPLWTLPHDERNRRIWEMGRKRPFAELRTLAAVTHAALMAALTAMPQNALFDASAFADMPPDWQPLDLITQNTTRHYHQHLSALRAWLVSGNAPAP